MTSKRGMKKLLGFSAFVAVWTLTVGGCLDGDTGTQGPAGADGVQGPIGPQGPAGDLGVLAPTDSTPPNNAGDANGQIHWDRLTGMPADFADGADDAGPGGTVTQVNTGDGLVGGPFTTTGTISIMPGDTDGQILRWDNSAVMWFLDMESTDALTLDGQTSADLDMKYVFVAGDTMTGLLTLSGDPTAILHATTKQYVDTAIAAAPALGWQLGGNNISVGDFLGTLGMEPLEFRVNNARALRIEPTALAADAPNIIGGHPLNSVTAGVVGATISGGGFNDGTFARENRVTADYATVSGGQWNSASGDRSTVGGGVGNAASGNRSTVGGGNGNTAIGSYATVGGGVGNTAVFAYTTVGGGDSNTASGNSSTVSGGVLNTAIGYAATVPGGRFNTAAGTYSFAAGYRAKANHPGAFVWGDSTATDIASTGVDRFIVRASGGTWFYSNSALTAGVYLPAGAGSWMNISDRNKKANFLNEDGEAALQKIAAMPIQSWNYKSQDPAIRHLGPTAQDFRAAFGLGESETGINTVDIDGVNLLAVQGLIKRTAQLQKENAALRDRLERIEKALGVKAP